MTFCFCNIAQIFILILTIDKWCVSNCIVTQASVSSFYKCLFFMTQSQGKTESVKSGLF